MNKQIEELGKEIHSNCPCGLFEDEAESIAKFVIEEQGYRRQEDVVREIIAEIEKRFEALLKQLPSNGKYEPVKIFIDAHWDFIANSILKKYGVTEE